MNQIASKINSQEHKKMLNVKNKINIEMSSILTLSMEISSYNLQKQRKH